MSGRNSIIREVGRAGAFAVAPRRRLCGFACFVWLMLAGGDAAAQQQFVLVDATFTATAQNTMKSQYPIAPLPAAPSNWRTPINWAEGSIHVRLEVIEKPTALKTLGNVCFENSMTLTCQPYPPPFSSKGVYPSSAKISSFWQYDVFDWTKKLDRVYVVLKDENERIVQGSAQFYPTKMRVTVWVVPPEKSFVAPAPTQEDDGDAGTLLPIMRPDAGAAEPVMPSVVPQTAGQSGQPATSLAPRVQSSGGSGAGGRTGARAGAGGAVVLQAQPAGARSVSDYIEQGSNCALYAGQKRSFGARLAIVFGVFGWVCFRRVRSRRRITKPE